MIIKSNGSIDIVTNNFLMLSDCPSQSFSLTIKFYIFNLLFQYHLSCFSREGKPSIFTFFQIDDYYICFDFDYRKLTCGLYWQLDELFVPINIEFKNNESHT